jgi:hypothetical protein
MRRVITRRQFGCAPPQVVVVTPKIYVTAPAGGPAVDSGPMELPKHVSPSALLPCTPPATAIAIRALAAIGRSDVRVGPPASESPRSKFNVTVGLGPTGTVLAQVRLSRFWSRWVSCTAPNGDA